MTINHNGHDHPATPAGRAACRKAGGATTPAVTTEKVPVTKSKAKRGVNEDADWMTRHQEQLDQVARKPKVKGDAEQLWRVPMTAIPEGSSLLGMPVYVSEVIRYAWQMGWRVDVGRVWNKEGARSVKIGSYRGWVWISWHRDGPGISSMAWQVDDVEARELTSMNEGLQLLKGE